MTASTATLAPTTQRTRLRSPGRAALRRLAANKMAVVGGLIVLFFVFLALFGGVLAPHRGAGACCCCSARCSSS